MFFNAINHSSGSLEVYFSGVKRSSSCIVIGGFQSSLSVSVFRGFLVVTEVVVTDSSKTRDCLLGFKAYSCTGFSIGI